MASSKRKKLVAGLGAAAVIGAAVAITGGTYAYFTDSDRTTGQNVAAGDLSVTVSQSGSGLTDKPVSIDDAAPGRVYLDDLPGHWGDDWYRMKVTNEGSVDGEIDSVEIVDLTGGTPNLADRLQIRAVIKPTSWEPGNWGPPAFEALDAGALSDLPGDENLDAGESTYVYFQIRWPNGTPDEDNPYQNADTSFRFQVNLDQRNQGA
ncbi:putative ribosomally synthesized peptide with SipW-like signal peptide [Spinactinospora alkalitolerans]|uniref:Putative ribosomally synthesized peptide with SipW-like signal peptide n=1 Tax=Spinactinospora alkalitolerans TaxID=687207 RepID=A0A852U478_9ACTN|nr:TasA family protein [Spinactinospora alkalitolerans]NYE50407.1 putative ribosomally synthesized peptide with SipW-like signal peptide [Spinactinospora alkalitolerans]